MLLLVEGCVQHHSYSYQSFRIKVAVCALIIHILPEVSLTPTTVQSGRLCLPTPARGSPGNSIECCLPCPVTDWVYEDGMEWTQPAVITEADGLLRLS